MSSDEDLDDIPDELDIYAGKSYDRINNFFNGDSDLETVDLQRQGYEKYHLCNNCILYHNIQARKFFGQKVLVRDFGSSYRIQ